MALAGTNEAAWDAGRSPGLWVFGNDASTVLSPRRSALTAPGSAPRGLSAEVVAAAVALLVPLVFELTVGTNFRTR